MSDNAAMGFINELRTNVELYDYSREIGSVDEMGCAITYHHGGYEEKCNSNYFCNENYNRASKCHGPQLHK